MLNRHSSRRKPLDSGFLTERLTDAASYDRIAGYFSSSILEIAGEALESVEGKIRVVCNSGLSRADVEVAKAAQAAMRREWCDSRPEELGDFAKPRFKRLHDLLRSGKMEVRVLPEEVFGLIHGKAGVITRANGKQTSFLGSANESKAAFQLNYELIWEDDSPEAVAWVQEEFNALWSSPFAVQLADFVVQDLDRLQRREVLRDVQQWREEPEPASMMVESPVYRQEVGLWEHQKHFVKLAFLRRISTQTKSLSLATATPVQRHPIEAYDLLDALAQGSGTVLGGPGSLWRDARRSLTLLLGDAPMPSEFQERWDWLRNPFPPASEGRDFEILRKSLHLPDDEALGTPPAWSSARAAFSESAKLVARSMCTTCAMPVPWRTGFINSYPNA